MDSNFLKRAIPHTLPCLFLLLLPLLYFHQPLFENRVLIYRDLFFFHYPLRYYWISLLHQGHAPLLNAALNGGQPLLANPNYGVFYPGNVLYLLLPFNSAWNFSLILHVVWASAGMYALTRSFSCTRIGSITAAVLFAYSGPLLSALNYYNLLITASWIPWVLFCFRNALDQRGRWIALSVVSLSAQILAGEPTVVFLTALLMIVMAIGIAKKSRAIVVALAIPILAIALSAVQILPTLQWLPNSGRSAPLDFSHSAAYWSLHPPRLLELVIPNLFGNPMSSEAKNFWGAQFSDSGYPYLFKLYCGLLPLLLLPFAWGSRTGKIGIAIFVSASLLSLGRFLPGYHFLFQIFPPLHLVRYPEKFFLLVPFGLALSTAAAITERKPSKRYLFPFTFLLFIVGIVFISSFAASEDAQQKLLWNSALQKSIIWSVLSVLALVVASLRNKASHTLALIPLLMAVDLFAVTRDVPQTLQQKELDTKPFLLSRFPETGAQPIFHDGETRLQEYFAGGIMPEFYLREAIHPLTGLKWGVQYGATDDIDRMGWKTSEARQKWIQSRFPRPEAIEEMRGAGIGRVISLAVVHSPQLPVERLLKLKENKFVWVYHVTPDPPAIVRWKEGKDPIRSEENSPDHIRMITAASEKRTLVIGRNAIPGWKATIDGNPVKVQSSPQGWILIDVPNGEHIIQLWYRPPGLLPGAVISAITSLIVVALFLIA